MSDNTFGDYRFPDWVPQSVSDSIKDFWGVFGRTHKDWLENAERNQRDYCTHVPYGGFGNPRFGTKVAYTMRDGTIVKGRYIHAWNNMGRLIDENGKVHYPSSCYMWCPIIGEEQADD